MSMQEKQTHKVIVHAARSVHGNRQEDYRFRLIRVQLVVMEYSLPVRIFQSTIMLRSCPQGQGSKQRIRVCVSVRVCVRVCKCMCILYICNHTNTHTRPRPSRPSAPSFSSKNICVKGREPYVNTLSSPSYVFCSPKCRICAQS